MHHQFVPCYRPIAGRVCTHWMESNLAASGSAWAQAEVEEAAQLQHLLDFDLCLCSGGVSCARVAIAGLEVGRHVSCAFAATVSTQRVH